MNRILCSIAIITIAGTAMIACGNKSEQNTASVESSLSVTPKGYKIHEFAHFTISVPEEFTTSDEMNSDIVRFSSEASNKWDDGNEHSSTATIDSYFMVDSSTSDIKTIANTMKLSEEAKGETCEKPEIDGNIITMRSYHSLDEGGKFITQRFWIVGKDGKHVGGNLSYNEKESKFYDAAFFSIVQSVKIK